MGLLADTPDVPHLLLGTSRPQSPTILQAISAAYEKIKDAATRARYEHELYAQASRPRTPHQQQHRAGDAQQQHHADAHGPSAASAAETWARASGDAAAMAEAFADWLREEASARRRDLESDIALASAAAGRRDWPTLRAVAARRAPLLLVLAVPTLLLRSPAATLVALNFFSALSTAALGVHPAPLFLCISLSLSLSLYTHISPEP